MQESKLQYFFLNFSVLVGCGLESIHLFHEALSRQTKHVQFVVFEREDKNLEQPSQLLRDVNSFFLLAYFFPNCDSDDQSKGRYELVMNQLALANL